VRVLAVGSQFRRLESILRVGGEGHKKKTVPASRASQLETLRIFFPKFGQPSHGCGSVRLAVAYSVLGHPKPEPQRVAGPRRASAAPTTKEKLDRVTPGRRPLVRSESVAAEVPLSTGPAMEERQGPRPSTGYRNAPLSPCFEGDTGPFVGGSIRGPADAPPFLGGTSHSLQAEAVGSHGNRLNGCSRHLWRRKLHNHVAVGFV
jgi:hypothetical protein